MCGKLPAYWRKLLVSRYRLAASQIRRHCDFPGGLWAPLSCTPVRKPLSRPVTTYCSVCGTVREEVQAKEEEGEGRKYDRGHAQEPANHQPEHLTPTAQRRLASLRERS